MKSPAGHNRLNEPSGKSRVLAIVVVMLAAFTVTEDSMGAGLFGRTRQDMYPKEDVRERRIITPQETTDEDAPQFKSRKYRKAVPDKLKEDLKRKTPVSQKDIFQRKEKRRGGQEGASSDFTKAQNQRVEKPMEPLFFGLNKTFRRQSSIDTRGMVKQHGSQLEKALKRGDLGLQKAAHTNLGLTFHSAGQYKRAVEHYTKADELARRSGIPKERGRSLHHLAAVWLALANYRTATRYGQESLRAFQQANDTEGVATAYNDLAQVEKSKGSFRKAVQNYEKALDTNKEKNELRFVTLTNLADLYLTWGEYKKAVDYYREALESAATAKKPSAEGDTLINMAKAYAEWGRHDEALENALQGLKVLSRARVSTKEANKVVGDLYMDAGQLDQAEPYVKVAGRESSLGRLLLLKSRFSEARVHYERLRISSERDGDLESSFTALTGLGRIAENLGDLPTAED